MCLIRLEICRVQKSRHSDALDLPEPTQLASLVDCGGIGDDDDSDGSGIGDDDSDGTIGIDDEENATSTTTGPSSSDLLQKAAVRFVLKTKESHRLTQTSMNCTIEDVTAFNQITLGELHFAVRGCFVGRIHTKQHRRSDNLQ